MALATYVITGTTPSSPGNAILGTLAPDPTVPAGTQYAKLDDFESFVVTANLVGATGGTLDVYIQSAVNADGTTWNDIAHYTQLAAGGAAVTNRWTNCRWNQAAAAPVVTGDAALAANTFIAGEWGDRIRVKVVAGASTTLGATITLRFQFNRVQPKT